MEWVLRNIIQDSGATSASELFSFIALAVDLGDNYDPTTQCVMRSLMIAVESAINTSGSDDLDKLTDELK